MFRSIDNKWLRLGAYLVLALAGFVGLLKVSEFANDAQDAANDAKEAVADADKAIIAVERQARQSTIQICEKSNEDRQVILQLVETVASGGGQADFAAVPGFTDLDPELQTFLLNLSAPAPTDGQTSRFVEVARQLLVQQNCEALAGK